MLHLVLTKFYLKFKKTSGCFRRAVLVRQAETEGDKPTDITPQDFAVRTVAQEYGGGTFNISGDILVFSNYKDQRLYKQSVSSKGQLHSSQFLCSTHYFFLLYYVNLVVGFLDIQLVILLYTIYVEQ